MDVAFGHHTFIAKVSGYNNRRTHGNSSPWETGIFEEIVEALIEPFQHLEIPSRPVGFNDRDGINSVA